MTHTYSISPYSVIVQLKHPSPPRCSTQTATSIISALLGSLPMTGDTFAIFISLSPACSTAAHRDPLLCDRLLLCRSSPAAAPLLSCRHVQPGAAPLRPVRWPDVLLRGRRGLRHHLLQRRLQLQQAERLLLAVPARGAGRGLSNCLSDSNSSNRSRSRCT